MGMDFLMARSTCTGGDLDTNATNAWTCLWFDPLDPSDRVEDIDRCDDFSFGCGDGFDVNRDGDIDITERYSNAEEYSFGIPDYWITERDGLWCSGTIQGLSELSCQDIFERPTGDSGWLGTDPTRSDSDYYSWSDLLASGLVVPGDGIPDGWEAHYGLDPKMPVTQSLILTTTAGIWIEMVSSYQIHLLRPLLGERRLATTRNIWFILTMDPG